MVTRTLQSWLDNLTTSFLGSSLLKLLEPVVLGFFLGGGGGGGCFLFFFVLLHIAPISMASLVILTQKKLAKRIVETRDKYTIRKS